MARSLLDGDDFSSIGSSRTPQKAGGSIDKARMTKIAVIVVCLSGAGLLVAWQSGLFDSKPKDTRTKEEIQRDEERWEQMLEEMQNLPETEVGDA